MPSPKVLYVCSEVFPLLKTGGLADVSAGLPPALSALGADVRLLLPGFPSMLAGVTPVGEPLALPCEGEAGWPAELGPRAATAGGARPVLQAGRISANGQLVWLLVAPQLYERAGHPYVDGNGIAWPNAAEQYAWLGWAAALLGCGLHAPWTPDVLHGHDWHSGLALAYLHALKDRGRAAPRTVFTIHNLAYQGVFDAEVRQRLGLPNDLFRVQGLEFHGRVSFMKAGLQYSDAITTVSPTYAREITSAEQGCGLDGLLRARQADLHGILNGVDEALWNPGRDPHVQLGFGPGRMRGKAQAKADLQTRMGLEPAPSALLFSVVSRLTEQKGLHLLPQVVDDLVQRGGQLVVLGAGDAAIETALQQAVDRHPGQVALYVGYDEALAHTVIAGADVIVVPSRFEPCGLTQLYGLRYGTLPLVRRVGGLADTVVDTSLENLADGSASGFVFEALDAASLDAAVRRAFALHRRAPDWRAVQRHAMGLRFDWSRAAEAYLRIYRGDTPDSPTATAKGKAPTPPVGTAPA